MKHYMDIERLKEKYRDVFHKGEMVVIQEKIDGANASFTTQVSDNGEIEVIAFSRKQQLSEDNTLRGFYEWTRNFPYRLLNEITENGRYIIFGEWLVKHTVKYPESAYNKFYMFDVWDTFAECYLSCTSVLHIYDQLKALLFGYETDIYFVPMLYKGEFESFDKCAELVGTTMVGAEPCGEGIVIKSQDRLLDKADSERPIYIKIVDSRFSETKMHKQKVPVDPATAEKMKTDAELVASIVTERRVSKILEKMVDEGQLRPDWDEKDLGFIAKSACKLVYDDCLKEEPEIASKVDNFGKLCGKQTMAIVRGLVTS